MARPKAPLRSNRLVRGLTPLVWVWVVAAAACQGAVSDVGGEGLGPAGGGPRPGDGPPLTVLPDPASCAPLSTPPGPYPLRRLTHREYGEAMSTTLGIDLSDVTGTLPSDERAEGFTNNAKTLIVTGGLAQAYMDLAVTAAERADAADLLMRFAGCTDVDAACGEAFVRGLGPVLLREHLTDAQVTRFGALFDVVRAENGTAEEAAKLALEALLQTPQFLYRTERNEASGDVRPEVLANRLAFFIWGAPPDDALRLVATSGGLATAEGIEAQAIRMMADARVHATSEEFFVDWFDLGHLDDANLPQERYPNFNRAIAQDMRGETVRFLQDLAWETQAPLVSMYSAEHTFVSEPLAAHYGISHPGGGFERVSLDGVAERRGILTHPSLLTAHAHSSEPSIVARGLFVLNDVLCDSVPPPPPDVDATPPEIVPGTPQKQASLDRIANAGCGGCHSRFDPFGHAFDQFDSAGAHRTVDPDGNALNTEGRFLRSDGTQLDFATVDDFAGLIASSERAQACIARKAIQYAAGRPLVSEDGCSVVQIFEDYSSRGESFQDLVLAIVTHPSFRAPGTEVGP